MKTIGYFEPSNSRVDTIKYANWGSRPYEYRWVIDRLMELNIKNMKVIDLGIGQPSLHGWPDFFRNYFKYDLYVGIDSNADLKKEGIETDTFKLQHMSMTDIKYPDNTFNIGICISTFEHFSSLFDLVIAFREIHRVLTKDSYLIITLDEIWDKNKKPLPETFWSSLDSFLRDNNYTFIDGISFGIKDLLLLIKPYFIPMEVLEEYKGNANINILHNEHYNNAISYCILKSVK